MNLQKKGGNQNQICKPVFDKKEINKDVEISNKIKSFYETFFKSHSSKNVNRIVQFLCAITTPSLINNDQIKLCEKDLFEIDLYSMLKNIQNNRFPGKYVLTKEWYEGFWDEIKELFITSITEAKCKGELSILQRKKETKTYIQNLRTISLLNLNTKIISNGISEKLKMFPLV